jgi:hypothetical protein
LNWEIKGKMPRFKRFIKALKDMIPEAERFLGHEDPWPLPALPEKGAAQE